MFWGLKFVFDISFPISWRTEELFLQPLSRTTHVFEPIFLGIPGFSGFLLFGYPMW